MSFAVADIKSNIFGTPSLKNIHKTKTQDFTLQFKHQPTVHPNFTKYTSLLFKDYPYFSYIYRINSKTQLRFKPNSSKIAHFPMKNYYDLHFTTTPQNQFFLRYPIHTSLINFVQYSVFLKFLQMINQTLVQLLYRTPQIILQHYLQDKFDISKFQLQMKNPNFIKSIFISLHQ